MDVKVALLQSEREIRIFCEKFTATFKEEFYLYCDFFQIDREIAEDLISESAKIVANSMLEFIKFAQARGLTPFTIRIKLDYETGRKIKVIYVPLNAKNQPLPLDKKIIFVIKRESDDQSDESGESFGPPGPNGDSLLN